MKCTDTERDTCNVEKMGCTGCAYNTDESIVSEIVSIEKRLNEISRENNLKFEIDTFDTWNFTDGKYTKISINAFKELS